MAEPRQFLRCRCGSTTFRFPVEARVGHRQSEPECVHCGVAFENPDVPAPVCMCDACRSMRGERVRRVW